MTDANSGESSQRREEVRRKKIKARETVEKSQNTVSFQCVVAPGSKSRLAKTVGIEQSGEMRDRIEILLRRARRCGVKDISKSK